MRNWTICLVSVVMLLAAGCNRGDAVNQPGTQSSPAADAAAPVSPSPSPSPDGKIYTVVSGDTLSHIAQRFDTTVEAILEANDLEDPDVLNVGDELIIPSRD